MKRPFIIQFEQLNLGIHEYDFFVDMALFELFGNESIIDAKIKVEIELNKSANMMDLNMVFTGEMAVPCDRCNESMTLNVNEAGRLVVKYGQTEHQDMDELLILDEHDHEINLDQYFYDSLCLMIPARNVHNESECDPEILAYLSSNEVTEENNEEDPRWDKLKGIHK